MSKELKTIPGMIEVPDLDKKESVYKPTELHLTQFWGGQLRRTSLQMGFINESGDYCHIQLNKDAVNQLIKELVNNYINL